VVATLRTVTGRVTVSELTTVWGRYTVLAV
jgi:hypothetical protein